MPDFQANQLSIDRSRPGIWTVSISNPPINMLDEGTIGELHGLVPLLEQEESLKVVVFESADPDFFFAHYDTSRAGNPSAKQAPRATTHGPTSSCGSEEHPSSALPR